MNFFLNTKIFFHFIGFFNKRFKFIEAVFLVYPANAKYADAYSYKWRQKLNSWAPWPAGLLRQNGKFVLMFAISSSNADFLAPENREGLVKLTEHMEDLRQTIGAKRKTFAGILPGVLYGKRIIRETSEADVTAEAVMQAVSRILEKEQLPKDTRIIVLGGKGFIGRRVVAALETDDERVSCVDLTNGGANVWPHHWRGQPTILVNVTTNSVIADYIDLMWPGMVVLNEVYPEPRPEVLVQLALKGCRCYHVVGVEALAIPPFPAAYRGAVPCCAAWPSSDMKVVIKQLILADRPRDRLKAP